LARDAKTTSAAELRRARLIIVSGLVAWSAIAVAVQLALGTIASFVLVGWGGSSLVCLAFLLGPLAASGPLVLAEDEVAPPGAETDTEVIDLRDAVVAPTIVEADVPLVLEASEAQ